MKPEHFIYKSDGLYYMQNVPEEPNTIGIPSELYQDYIEPYEQALERAKAEAIKCDSSIVGPFFKGMYDNTEFLNAIGGLDPNKIYTINMEEEIEIVDVCNLHSRQYCGMCTLVYKPIARIAAPKKEEEIEDGWTLSREKMPDVDGFYYVYAFVHEECGNVHPVHIIAECRINQWVKPHVGYQMTYWRKLLYPPIIKSTEDSFEIKRKPL